MTGRVVSGLLMVRSGAELFLQRMEICTPRLCGCCGSAVNAAMDEERLARDWERSAEAPAQRLCEQLQHIYLFLRRLRLLIGRRCSF